MILLLYLTLISPHHLIEITIALKIRTYRYVQATLITCLPGNLPSYLNLGRPTYSAILAVASIEVCELVVVGAINSANIVMILPSR